MDNIALRKYAEQVIINQSSPEERSSKVAFFGRLWECGLVNKQRILKAAINHYYEQKLKDNQGHAMNSIYDTCNHFEVSISTVKNTIYHYRNVVFRF